MSVGQDDALDLLILKVDALGRLRMVDDWHPYLVYDDNDDDSDKDITVTTDYEWLIQSISIEYTSSADVGDRQVTVEIQDDGANIIGSYKAGAVQAASLTRFYTFAPHLQDLTSFRDTAKLLTPIPELLLDEAYVINVYDSAAIAAAADDMYVGVLVKRRIKES